ncbi:hypothetical protein [Halomicrobium urmianum]|uniref:hypothetical protein n=1 Tax=Halomicrobium urmianum TaxID=1586233 RepID=UPI001CD94A7E|nr:hypothetical protein [Halomicrobium urmianum]
MSERTESGSDGRDGPGLSAATIREQMRRSPVGDWARRGGRLVFGDRAGLALWLGLTVVLALTWRVGVFVTDTYTVANAMVAVGDGHLAIHEVRYSLTMGTMPGLHEVDGTLYGRNYGQAVLSLPLLLALEAGAVVAQPGLLLAGAWSLAVVWLARLFGDAFGRPSVRAGGAALGLVAFAVHVAVGAPVERELLPLVALQGTSLFAAAGVGLFTYRILVPTGRRLAVAAGVATALASPVAFWATIPKRHVVVTALLFAGLLCFATSRRADGRRGDLALAGAYCATGLVAWVHAFEGFFLFVGLAAVDRLTERATRRRLATSVVGLTLGLLPVLVTNVLISGNPIRPPRLLPGVGVGDVELTPSVGEDGLVPTTEGGSGDAGGTGDPMGGEGSGSDASDGAGPGGDGDSTGSGGTDGGDGGSGGSTDGGSTGGGLLDGVDFEPPSVVTDEMLYIAGFVWTTVAEGVAAIQKGEWLWHVLVRSGRIPGLRYAENGHEAVELAVLEAAPLLGALLAAPVVAARRLRRRMGALRSGRTGAVKSAVSSVRRLSPAAQTDLLAVAWLGTFLVIYASRLPLFSQITARYVLPVMPLGVYLVARLPPVAAAVSARTRVAVVAYGLAVLGGGALLAGTLTALDAAVGEAFQFHALVGLGAAALAGAVVAGRTIRPGRVSHRVVAAAVGTTAGATTAFYLLAGVEYVQYGPAAVGLARAFEALLPAL